MTDQQQPQHTAAEAVQYWYDAAVERREERDRLRAVVARVRQMANAWEQRLPEVIRTPAVVSALRAALEPAVVSAPVQPTTHADDETAELSTDEQIRGVQGWVALDIHQALGRPVDNDSPHQGHKSWADWWAELCAAVRLLAQADRARRVPAITQADLDEFTTQIGMCHHKNPEGDERCGRKLGHLGFHRYVEPLEEGGDTHVSWAADVPEAQPPIPRPLAVLFATPCATCDHTLNWHRHNVGCIVGTCGCGRFEEQPADSPSRVAGEEQPATETREADRSAVLLDIATELDQLAETDVIRKRRSLATARRLLAVELRRMAEDARQDGATT